jgi:putative oxidoreductase
MLAKLVHWLIGMPATALNPLQSLLALGLRWYVGWQFFKAGWLKINAWDSTLYLFQYEYRVPLLSPVPAAIAGTFGELFFPALLFIGLTTRLAALGLSFVNIVAVVSYAHVIFSEGFESTVAGHYLWGLMLVVVMVYGPGGLSVDELLKRGTRETNA